MERAWLRSAACCVQPCPLCLSVYAGIGFLMVQVRDFLRTDVIVVCLIVYAFLGLLADFIVRSLERLLLQWRPDVHRPVNPATLRAPPSSPAAGPSLSRLAG